MNSNYRKTNKFTSSHKIGDYVKVSITDQFLAGTITAVKFDEDGKVTYDVRVGDYKLYDLPGIAVMSMAEHMGNIAASELTNV